MYAGSEEFALEQAGKQLCIDKTVWINMRIQEVRKILSGKITTQPSFGVKKTNQYLSILLFPNEMVASIHGVETA